MLQLDNISSQLINNSRFDDFCGFDPFDGLNSKFIDEISLPRNSLVGLALIQLHKRCIVNLRPLARVPKKRNPKGVALFILGLLEDHQRTKNNQYLQEAITLGDWLLSQASSKETYRNSCWGYHFDWKARAFFVPVGKPNIISTVYVSRALYALGEASGNRQYLDIALDSAKFIVNTLHTHHEGREFFAYIPGENTFVHNASLWGAAWVAFAASKIGDQSMAELALKVAHQSVSEQAKNGSWVYGSRHHHQFIDGFHTGYNLEALDLIRKSLNTQEFDKAISLGLDYYRNNFFLDDGTAKYYHNNLYPLDMHSVSQAVITFLKVSGSKEDIQLSSKVLHRAIETMYLPEKHQFIYQKTRWFTNKINYSRWTQAWSYYAIAFYNHHIQG